jgi:hypothetical protein
MSFGAEELELRVPELAGLSRINNNKGIRLCKEEFVCNLK